MFVCSLPCFLVFFQINCFEPVLQCLFTVLFGSALSFVNILPLCTSVCLFVCLFYSLFAWHNLSVYHCSYGYVYPCCHLSYHSVPLWSEVWGMYQSLTLCFCPLTLLVCSIHCPVTDEMRVSTQVQAKGQQQQLKLFWGMCNKFPEEKVNSV